MNEMVQFLSAASAGAADALFSAIWQGAALAIVVGLCLRMFPRLSSAARSLVWLNVFVLLILLHFVPAFAPRTPEAASRVTAVHLDMRWSLAIALVWLALSVWRAVQFILGVAHLGRLGKRAIPVQVDGAVRALLADASGRRPAELCVSDQVRRPSVLGFFRPRILLPPGLVEALTPQELQQVVLHEMEHLRRGDDWTNLVQKIGLVLFPLNPVLVWVERRLCAERELACDDRVIHASAGRKAYALCLARLAEISLFRRGFSLVLGLWERRPEVVRRIHRIVGQPVRVMGRRSAMVATGSVLAGALGCAVALAHSPQLVSFAPGHPAAVVAAPLDPHVVAQALGGTPQMAKAAVPLRTVDGIQPAGRKAAVARCTHKAVLKSAKHRQPAGSQIAGLTPVPAPAAQPIFEERQVIMLGGMPAFQTERRVVLAVTRDGRESRPVVIPARYAIVPTPTGWLIIQI